LHLADGGAEGSSGDEEGEGGGESSAGWRDRFSMENIIWNCICLAIVILIFVILYFIVRKIRSCIQRRFSEEDDRKNYDSSTFSDDDRLEVGVDTSGGRTIGRPQTRYHERLVESANGSAKNKAESCREQGLPEEKMRFTYDQDYELKEVFLDDKVTL